MTSCSIIRNPETKEISRVLAPNGQDSQLFKEINNTVSDKEEAIKLWAYAYTDQFKQKFGDWEKLARLDLTDPGMDEVSIENLATQFDEKLDENGEPLIEEVDKIAKETIEDPFGETFRSLTDDRITFGQPREIEPVIYDDQNIKYTLKAIKVVTDNMSKIQSWERNRSISPEILFNKILQLGVPRNQLALLIDQPGNTVEEKLASFAATYSYAVEINLSIDPKSNQNYGESENYETTIGHDLMDKGFRRGEFKYYKNYENKYIKKGFGEKDEKIVITKEEYENAFNSRQDKPSRYYSNMTVPGGTNYTENEIATPAVTPAIKGHAQFATDQGIGWFRSDEQTINAELFQEPTDVDDLRYQTLVDRTRGGEPTKTRRILEVQSDLFQKGRDKELLVKSKTQQRDGVGSIPYTNTGEYAGLLDKIRAKAKEVLGESRGERPDGQTINLDGNTYYTMNGMWYLKEKEFNNENQFLQLLNKDNNWVTFFVKSIVQDSAKKGYEKVLFPKGDTANKIEGQTTLETFKKEKEDRLKKLKEMLESSDNSNIVKYGLALTELQSFKKDSEGNVYKVDILEGVTYKNGKEISQKEFFKVLQKEKLERAKQNIQREISAIKAELERVDEEGFAVFSSIWKFYENTINNILKKQGYNPKQITDEYGNTWNEIELKPVMVSESIMLQTEQTAAAEPTNEELNNRVSRFLEKIGVSIQSVNEIRDAAGNKLSATAKADMLNRIIQVVDGKEQIDTLPEEAAHFFVEMLGPGNPLYKEMFRKITNYKIYASTLDKYKNLKAYRNLDGTVNFDKVKKEAIGKLIAEHIIRLNLGDETDARVADALTWWQKVWKFITNLFARADENPFETAAEQILDTDISALDVNAILNGEFYQYADPVGNLTADQDKITLDNTVDPRTSQKRHNYYYNGVLAKGSVTGVYVDRYLKKIFRSDERTDRQRVLDLVKADYGDIIHEEMQNIVNSWTNPDGTKRAIQVPIKTKLNASIYKRLNDYVQAVMNQYEPGTLFKTEVKIFDKKASIGGSIDLLVVKPSMEVDIYDWKSTEVGKDQTDIKEYKETVFKIQLDEYRKILAKEYGFMNFGTIRAIPIRTEFNYDVRGDISSLRNLEIGSIDPSQIPDNKSYLLPILLRNEPTGDKQLDALIERMNGIYDKIKSTRYSIAEINNKREELKSLREVLRDLQLRKRVDKLIELGMIEFKKYSDKIENNTLTGKDIVEGIKILEVFSDSGVMLYDLMEEYSSEAEESEDKKVKSEYAKLNRQFLQMTSRVNGLIMQMKEYQREQSVKLGEERGILNLLDPEATIDTISGLWQSLSNIKQKAFRIFSKILRKAQGIRDTRVKESIEKLKALKEDFVKWSSQKGLSANKAMEMILEIDSKGNWNGNFLEKYDSEFNRLKKQAIAKGDVKWLKDNLQFDPNNQYDAALARQKSYFKAIIYSSDEETNKKIVEKKIQDWIDQHNILDKRGQLNMIALLNPRNLFLKPIDNWLTAKWKELYKQDSVGNYINKPLVDMYEYFQTLTRKAEDLGMLDRYSPKFIPSIHASKLENLVFGDVSNFLSLGKFFDELEVDSGTKYTPQIDPTDGSIINRIPVYFIKDMGAERKDAAGNTYMDYTAKSRDLFKVFAVWTRHVYNYEAMSSIEDDAINLIEVERQKKSLVTDLFNNEVIVNGKVKAINKNDRNAKLLEDFVNYYLYNRTSGSITDYEIRFAGKKYSLLKTITAAMRYFSLKSLAFNLVSASAQFVGGTGNTLFTAQKGIFFTKNTWAKSMYYTSSSKKAMAALKYLNILQENAMDTMVDQLSLSTSTKVLTSNNAFVLQRIADRGVQYPVAIALMLEHMIDPSTGNIVSIQNFVKAKYDYNNKFYDLPDSEREQMRKNIDKEVGELQETKSLFAIGKIKDDGSFEIPGIDSESDTLLDFRDKIKGVNKRIIGNQTRDDINGIRTTLLGSSLMQFRNWIPEMFEERISGLKYDDELQNWTYGKFNVFFGDVFSKRFPTLLKSIVTGFGHDAEELAKIRYRELKAKAIEKGEDFTITEGEFIDLYIANLRSMMAELIVITASIAAVTSMTSTGDDDRKHSGFKKYLTRAFKKYYNEFIFYYNPIEFVKLVKNPVPVLGLAEDMARFIGATFQEGYGMATGDQERTEKAMPMKQLLRSVPIGKEFLLIAASVDDDFRKEWNIRVDNYFYK